MVTFLRGILGRGFLLSKHNGVFIDLFCGLLTTRYKFQAAFFLVT